MAKILVSVPILGKPDLKMIHSLYQAILSCKEHQIRLLFNENDSLISRVRNAHISMFMDDFPETDYFVSIDSDLEIVNCFPSNNIFTKLVENDKDFTGGVYALKRQDELRSSSVCMNHNTNWEFDSGLIEMKWLSTGCWCLRRSVVEKMVDAYPELTYDGDDNMSDKKVYGLYIPMLWEFDDDETEPGKVVRRKKYLSEDWSFAERWRRIGGKIFADTSIVLRHYGTYPYALWDVNVQARHRPPPPQPGFQMKGLNLANTAVKMEKTGLPPNPLRDA